MEAMERLGSYGMTANLMVYLVREFHMHQVEASNVINIWDFACNFLPIIGAIIADVYIGKFLTIALGAFASLLVCSFASLATILFFETIKNCFSIWPFHFMFFRSH